MNIGVKSLRGFITQGLRRFLHGLGLNRACICFGVQERKVGLVQKCKVKKSGLSMNLTRSVANGASEEKAKEINLFSLRRRIRTNVKTGFTFVKLQSEKCKLFFASVTNRTIKLTALTTARNM